MKNLTKWLYRKIVNEIYIPEYKHFSIGVRGETIPGAKCWMSYLPEVLVIHIKTKDDLWQDCLLER